MQNLYTQLRDKYRQSRKSRFLMLIGGCSRSGKSTLAEFLKHSFEDQGIATLIVKLDNWLLGVNERKGDETVRERYNYAAIVNAAKIILTGKKMYPPLYDPKTRLVNRNNREFFYQLSKGICIIEGVIALDIPELRNMADMKLFVDLDDALRKQRVIDFYLNYKKCSLEEARNIMETREREEIPIAKSTRIFADIIFQ